MDVNRERYPKNGSKGSYNKLYYFMYKILNGQVDTFIAISKVKFTAYITNMYLCNKKKLFLLKM